MDDVGRSSKAASVPAAEEMVTISMKEYRELLQQDGKCANTINQTIRKSKAASVIASGINQAQVIHDLLNSRHGVNSRKRRIRKNYRT